MVPEKISRLCKEKKISIARLEREVGLGNGVIAGWDKSIPRFDTVKKVASYFGMSADELMEKDGDETRAG